MVRIYKDFSFEAAHQLEGYEGNCANVHGHSYKLRVGLYGKPEVGRGPNEGFLMDFGKLKSKVKEIFLDQWDHSFLARGDEKIIPALEAVGSKIVYLGFRPTAENMCTFILSQLYDSGLPVESVVLYETETNCAEARLEDVLKNASNQIIYFDEVNMSQQLAVCEIFGPTIQGEGSSIGKKSIFLRTYGCDDSCEWCDTGYAWNGEEKPAMLPLSEIIATLDSISIKSGCKHIILTGGNPCIHNETLGDLIKHLRKEGYTFAVETQGTVIPNWIGLMNNVSLSPKPPSSGNTTSVKKVSDFINRLNCLNVPFSIKVVVFDENDFAYFKDLYHKFASELDNWFIQPGNPGGDFNLESSMNSYEHLVEKALSDRELSNVRVLPQLHTWLWGDKREV
ncbi:MAG: 7-carboxy-7-deazaguanine synthase QueE [Lachnospiraceae bacterium]